MNCQLNWRNKNIDPVTDCVEEVVVCPGTINDVGESKGARTGVWLVHINYTTFITTTSDDRAGSGLLLGVFVLRRNQNNLGGKPLIVVILTIVTAVTLTKPHQTLTGSEIFYSQNILFCCHNLHGNFPFVFV